MVDDVPVHGLGYRVDLTRVRLVDRVEQRRESVAQVEAPAAAVANVENTLELSEQRLFVVKVIAAPIDGMTRRSLEAPLARSVVTHLRIPAGSGDRRDGGCLIVEGV